MLLLVNLQLTTDDGSLSIGFGEVAAQSYWEEELPEVVVTGNAYEECNLCHHTYLKKEMEQHQEYECPERLVTCDICHKPYKYSEPHTCDAKEGNCAFCGKPVDQCTCNGPVFKAPVLDLQEEDLVVAMVAEEGIRQKLHLRQQWIVYKRQIKEIIL